MQLERLDQILQGKKHLISNAAWRVINMSLSHEFLNLIFLPLKK